jgi:plastocyanin
LKALVLGLLSLVLTGCASGVALPLQDIGPLRNDPHVAIALRSIQGSDVTVQLTVTNFTIVPPAQATTPHKYGEGHIHLFLDVPPTAPGEIVPRTTGIFHVSQTSFTIPNVPNGHHVVWAVLGFSDHMPYETVAVKDGKVLGTIAKLEVNVNGSNYVAPVQPQPQPSQSTATGPSPAPTSTTTAPSGGGGSATIKVEYDAANQGKFVPDPDTVKVGTTVTWDFVDGQGGPHTATADDGSFDSSSKVTGNPGDKFTFTFTKPGKVPYHCNYHANMKGTIIVQ